AGTIRLAARRGRHGGVDTGAAVDAARRDRLANAAANVAAGAGRLTQPGDRLRQIDSTIGLGRPNRRTSDPLVGVTIVPDNLPDDPAALKRIIAAMAQDAVAAEALIAKLKFQLARYRRAEFGRSSEKLSCRACDTVVAALVPDHAIARGRAGAGLLAHIVVSKYDDHLPLYRQAEIFARGGVNLETSTLSGWVGATAAALKPLVDALAADVLAGDSLHVDDTPVPVLAPGTGKTKTGQLWTYVRDERPFAGSRPPAALFF